MSRALSFQDKVSEGEYAGLFNVISDYVYALDTLDRYDYQTLGIEKTTKEELFNTSYLYAIYPISKCISKLFQNRLEKVIGKSSTLADELNE